MNTKDNTLMIHVVPSGTYPVYKYANQIGFGLQISEHNAFTFAITIPTQKSNIVIKCKSFS